MIDALLQVSALAASAMILYRAEPALNRMSRATHFMVRVAMVLLVVGAAAQVGSVILFDKVPAASDVFVLFGIAALLSCERRLRVLVPHSKQRV